MAELPVFDVDEAAAYERLMRFLAVEGVTGHEAAIAREVTAALREAGVPKSAIRHDAAHDRIPVPTECGNLIVTLPGTRSGPRLLFSTHLDTVPLAAGAGHLARPPPRPPGGAAVFVHPPPRPCPPRRGGEAGGEGRPRRRRGAARPGRRHPPGRRGAGAAGGDAPGGQVAAPAADAAV